MELVEGISLGNELLRARKASGLSQKNAAKELELTASYLSLLERDLREPSWNVLRRMTALYEWNITVIVTPVDLLAPASP